MRLKKRNFQHSPAVLLEDEVELSLPALGLHVVRDLVGLEVVKEALDQLLLGGQPVVQGPLATDLEASGEK